jgi:hypothetical protein
MLAGPLYLGPSSVLLRVMAPRVGLSQFTVWDGQSWPHYTFGFHNVGSSGGGQDRRAALFDAYAADLSDTFSGLFDMSAREAWAEANELVEGPDVQWAYLRATSPTLNTYEARPGETEPTDLGSDRSFFTGRGSC